MEQIRNTPIGPRYALRLEEMGRWHRIEALCSKCRNRQVLKPAMLQGRFPGYTRIIDLEKKLRCTACGNRAGNTLQIGRVARD